MSQHTPQEAQQNFWLPLFVLLLGAALSTAASLAIWENTKIKRQNYFEGTTREAQEDIQTHLATYMALLRGASGFVAVAEPLDLNRFGSYLNRLRLWEYYPGAEGIGLALRIPSPRSAQILQDLRNQGIQQLDVWPKGTNQEQYVVLYMEGIRPENQQLVGFDLASDPIRLEAMERARDTGRSAASSKLRLNVGTPERSKVGFAIFAPIFRTVLPPESIEERRESLVGFVFSPFDAAALFSAVFVHLPSDQTRLEVYDREPREENLLYRMGSLSAKESGRQVTVTNSLEIAGEKWTAVLAASPKYKVPGEAPTAILVWGAGMVCSILLALFTHSAVRARRTAEQAAAELRQSQETLFGQQEQLHVTLQSIVDGVIATDRRGIVEFINPTAEALTGCAYSGIVGRPIHECFQVIHPTSRNPISDPVAEVLQSSSAFDFGKQAMLISKDGKERDIDGRAAPIRKSDGSLAGVVVVFHEVTEQRWLERRGALQHDITRILAEAASFSDATPQLLEALCKHSQFCLAQMWRFFPEKGASERLGFWFGHDPQIAEFVQGTEGFRPPPGEGIVGAVWNAGEPVWISDVSTEPQLTRSALAAQCQLHACFAFPILVDGAVFGAIEVFSRRPQTPDRDLLKVAHSLGSQIGQFIERKRAERSLLQNESLYRFLAEAGKTLTESLDYAKTLSNVAQLAVPTMADWCAVDMLNDCGELERLHVVHSDAGKVALVKDLAKRYPPRLDAPHGIARVVQTGSAELYPEIEDAMLARLAQDAEHLRILRELGLTSAMVVPIKTRTRVLGGLTFAAAESGRRYDERDLAVAQELALRAGFAIDNALLYQEAQREIAERKQAQEALREREEWFRLVVSSTHDYAIFALDTKGRISSWNPGAERILGYSEQEIIGQATSLLFTEEDQANGVAEVLLDQALKDGRAVDERWHVRKDNSTFWASDYIIALRDNEGALRGFARIMRDMTEQKKVEEAIRQLNEELERRVQQRTAALQESHEQMEAFTYTVAHDLRAPLRAMQGFSQALAEDYESQLDSPGCDYLRRINGAAQRMDALIQDLLAYSRLTRSGFRFELVNIETVLNPVLDALAGEIKSKQAEVAVQRPLPQVHAHPATLEHILSNLLANALKFVAKNSRPKIRVYTEMRDSFVRLWVEDNGIGISPEHQERIFRVFERLHGPEAYPGTGIGLAMVKKGTERMGGQAGVESQVGQGSRFWIELPASQNA